MPGIIGKQPKSLDKLSEKNLFSCIQLIAVKLLIHFIPKCFDLRNAQSNFKSHIDLILNINL